MIDRRDFFGLALLGIGGAIATPVLGAVTAEETRLQAVFDQMYAAWLARSPEGQTDLGLDIGARSPSRSRLDDRSRAADDAFLATQRGLLGKLERIDGSKLSAESRLHRDIVAGHLKPAIAGAVTHRFGAYGDSVPYGLAQLAGAQPYILSHLNGVYAWMPEFLINKHPLSTPADVEAYIARMEGLATAMDQETERARADLADHGVTPPGFIIAKTLRRMREFHDTPSEQAAMVVNLLKRGRSLGAPEVPMGQAIVAMERRIKPALARQIAFMAGLQTQSSSRAGVWALPEGEAYYGYALEVNTSLTSPAEEIHREGLEEVAALTARADALLKRQGYSKGTVGARLAALASETRFRFPNDAGGREQILALFRSRTGAMTARLPAWFGALPDQELRIEPVPAALEASAPRGYYQRGALDGSRPGVYFANLRDTGDWSRFFLPTFAFHEGVPGHHLQLALALKRSDSPSILKLLQMSGFSEGWALYAEQLAAEMGMYAEDPFGEIGYIQSILFRAVRLVVDTGLHHLRWDRERAVRYVADVAGETPARSESEVDRYVVWPGQACSYKLGHNHWIALRRRAQAAMGARFDIRAFHDVALRHGAMSFALLQRTIDEWAST